MRHCIRYALSYPERMTVDERGVDFAALASLTFASPDTQAFPLLKTAVSAYSKGTTAPAALIAADEEAVAAFVSGKIGFNDISDVVSEVTESFTPHAECTEETVRDAEYASRRSARDIIKLKAASRI